MVGRFDGPRDGTPATVVSEAGEALVQGGVGVRMTHLDACCVCGMQSSPTTMAGMRELLFVTLQGEGERLS